MNTNSNLPVKGFYQHYKHDVSGVPNNYLYEVIGIGRNTEDESLTVLYRPLYKSDWMPPADYQSRPLEMFMENVEANGESISRFTRITDQEIISKLEEIKTQLYG